MRLVTYLDSHKKNRLALHVGALNEGTLIDLNEALQAKGVHCPPDMNTLISQFNELGPVLATILHDQKEGKLAASAILAEKSVTLLSPIPRPLSMRDGYAFRQHVEAARRNRGVPMAPEFDLFPIFYYTNHLAVTGPGEIPVRPAARDKLDFELEVAIVIGKEGRDIPAAKADEYIFGFMIMNDWSARSLQMEEMKMNLGPAKGKDFATTLGPYLVTRDELAKYAQSSANGERHDLTMRCIVNGKQVSLGNVKDMSWTFAQIIERISYGVTLHPGEVIGSGTVGTGCFLELNGSKITDNQWLQDRDEVILEIDGLGKLTNTIKAVD